MRRPTLARRTRPPLAQILNTLMRLRHPQARMCRRRCMHTGRPPMVYTRLPPAPLQVPPTRAPALRQPHLRMAMQLRQARMQSTVPQMQLRSMRTPASEVAMQHAVEQRPWHLLMRHCRPQHRPSRRCWEVLDSRLRNHARLLNLDRHRDLDRLLERDRRLRHDPRRPSRRSVNPGR